MNVIGYHVSNDPILPKINPCCPHHTSYCPVICLKQWPPPANTQSGHKIPFFYPFNKRETWTAVQTLSPDKWCVWLEGPRWQRGCVKGGKPDKPSERVWERRKWRSWWTDKHVYMHWKMDRLTGGKCYRSKSLTYTN